MISRFVACVLLVFASTAHAEVRSITVHERKPFANGRSFGEVGPYEEIRGVVRYAIDPNAKANLPIVDLDLAPRNAADGKVEFEADLVILAPKNLAKGNGALFYDVNNRGKRLALGMFNRSPYPSSEELALPELNGFLMRRGYTVVWSGWIGELLPGDDRLLLKAPPAFDKGKPVRGPARFEFSTDKHAKWLPISRRDAHGSYPPSAEGEAKATLTKRNLESDPRIAIPRDRWKLIRMPLAAVKNRVAGTLPQIRCELDGGFEPGALYELIYEAEGSIVQGAGFAAVRDLVSYLRYGTTNDNPVRGVNGKSAFTRAHGFGVSQSGRFLRHFLYQGFNLDEQGRIVFDGLMPHVAGGGLGFFNHRLAQPTRHNGQHEDHLYPCDIFPFGYGPSKDPVSGTSNAILPSTPANLVPKIMHTHSAAEYWHRSGSLVHTEPVLDGASSKLPAMAKIPANVRIYSFAGTQHGPAAAPPALGMGQNLPNPADYRPFLRALLDSLDAWTAQGIPPPESWFPVTADDLRIPTVVEPILRHPRRFLRKPAVSELVRLTDYVFPKIPGVKTPRVVQAPPVADFGPEFRTLGRLGPGVPTVKGSYLVLVPRADEDGNDLGMLTLPDVEVPLATYTGWNLRRQEVGANDQLANLLGSYLPFAKTKAERDASGDPRKSIAERYASFDDYLKQYHRSCDELRQEGFLLAEDVDRLLNSRSRFQGWFPK